MSILIKTQWMAQDQPAGHVDAVISLGSFCHVGGMLWIYDIKDTNSPFDNFGIRTWHSIIPILRNRFADYWRLEDMVIGEAIEDASGPNNAKRMTLKTYCTRYNLENKHHFPLEENSLEELKGYSKFRQKLALQEHVFLKECECYGNIRFVCKAMSEPELEDSEVTEEHILQLLDILGELRQGKAFTLALAVPAKRYDGIKKWAVENQIQNLHVACWQTVWNNEKGEEWDDLLRGVTVPEDRYERLWNDIIGDTSFDLASFNTTY